MALSNASSIMLQMSGVSLSVCSCKRTTFLVFNLTEDSTCVHFYSVAALLAMQRAVLATAISFVRLTICLSVIRWYPIQTNEDRIMWSSL